MISRSLNQFLLRIVKIYTFPPRKFRFLHHIELHLGSTSWYYICLDCWWKLVKLANVNWYQHPRVCSSYIQMIITRLSGVIGQHHDVDHCIIIVIVFLSGQKIDARKHASCPENLTTTYLHSIWSSHQYVKSWRTNLTTSLRGKHPL